MIRRRHFSCLIVVSVDFESIENNDVCIYFGRSVYPAGRTLQNLKFTAYKYIFSL